MPADRNENTSSSKPATDRSLAVHSWREHRAADKFVEFLSATLNELERDAYPQNCMGNKGHIAAINALAALQDKVVAGMARFVESGGEASPHLEREK